MRFLEKLKAIERLDQLIKLKATGSADDLATRLSVTRSTVYELIECMRNMGADINYCKQRKSFYYESEKFLAIGFVEKDKIKGGNNYLNIFEKICYYPNFSDKEHLSLHYQKQ
jgi:biotin operon repressor